MGIGMKRETKRKAPLTNRVKRIVGQVQGIGRMIEEDRDCVEILNTVSAVHAALRALEGKLLEDHVCHCVTEAAKDPAELERRMGELIKLYRRKLS